GTANTAGARFHVGLDVAKGLLKNFQRVFYLQFASGLFHALVYQAFGNLLFTIAHNAVNNTGYLLAAVYAVGLGLANEGFSLVPRHWWLPSGLFFPWRLCIP